MNTLVPALPHRFDYLEIATANVSSVESLFGDLGFCTTQERESAIGLQRLMIKGRVRILISQGANGTYQNGYFLKHGEGVCAVAYHMDSAKKTLNILRQQKPPVVVEDDFKTEEDDLMFLQTSAIKAAHDRRMIFVTRSGAPHDVLSPFAPNFKKVVTGVPAAAASTFVFSKLEESVGSGEVTITFLSDREGSHSLFQEKLHFKFVHAGG